MVLLQFDHSLLGAVYCGSFLLLLLSMVGAGSRNNFPTALLVTQLDVCISIGEEPKPRFTKATVFVDSGADLTLYSPALRKQLLPEDPDGETALALGMGHGFQVGMPIVAQLAKKERMAMPQPFLKPTGRKKSSQRGEARTGEGDVAELKMLSDRSFLAEYSQMIEWETIPLLVIGQVHVHELRLKNTGLLKQGGREHAIHVYHFFNSPLVDVYAGAFELVPNEHEEEGIVHAELHGGPPRRYKALHLDNYKDAAPFVPAQRRILRDYLTDLHENDPLSKRAQRYVSQLKTEPFGEFRQQVLAVIRNDRKPAREGHHLVVLQEFFAATVCRPRYRSNAVQQPHPLPNNLQTPKTSKGGVETAAEENTGFLTDCISRVPIFRDTGVSHSMIPLKLAEELGLEMNWGKKFRITFDTSTGPHHVWLIPDVKLQVGGKELSVYVKLDAMREELVYPAVLVPEGVSFEELAALGPHTLSQLELDLLPEAVIIGMDLLPEISQTDKATRLGFTAIEMDHKLGGGGKEGKLLAGLGELPLEATKKVREALEARPL